MIRIAIVQVLIIVTLSSLVTMSACCIGNSDSNRISIGTLMMKNMPRNFAESGCVYLDIAAMRGEYKNLYSNYQESFQLLGDYGIDFEDVDWIATLGLSLFLLEGRFDLARITEELRIRDYTKRQYRGVEVWESNTGDIKDWVAFLDDMVLAGYKDNVINCIEVVIDGEDSLYDHEDIREVMVQLPAGLDMSVASDELNNNLLAHGESLENKDQNTMKLTVVHKYISEQAAHDGAQGIAQDMQRMLSNSLQEVQVQQEGQFVKLTAEVAPEALLYTDDDGSQETDGPSSV